MAASEPAASPRNDGAVEITESGRPKVPRPMPDTSSATHCPHCNAETGAGHYVCWNCSRDVRMKEQTEEDMMSEYHLMLAQAELRLEARNQRFFRAGMVVSLAIALAGIFLHFLWGSIALFVLFAALFLRFWMRSRAREARIRSANEMPKKKKP